MANRNDSNQPTNANEVRKQNQKSTQKATTPQGNNTQTPSQGSNYQSEFASETNVNEVTKQNQQSAQQGNNYAQQTSASQTNRSEFATDVNEVKKQNQQSAQKKNNASAPQANRSTNSTK